GATAYGRPMPFPALLAIALVAGFVGAMSGMGGGVVLIPVLRFFGMDIKRAIALSIVSVIRHVERSGVGVRRRVFLVVLIVLAAEMLSRGCEAVDEPGAAARCDRGVRPPGGRPG